MDQRYKESRDATDAQERRSEAYARALTVASQRRAGALSRKDLDNVPPSGRTYGDSFSPGPLASSFRGMAKADNDFLFNVEGGGVYGASSAAAEGRKAAAMGRGKQDLYLT